ncbi:MAG: hypothetical protein Unbinned6354contig1000_8 [Prokaryotic dsDNA virus sp.]|nr:MAG: hypothetical protein Unbinned6354contig1000_8 [Prokaryotic dsDNA virus sp.]|tara:strand:+ start:16998 stop:17258 length:261 start_codon:yes stop_codon:yes gene_type:complete
MAANKPEVIAPNRQIPIVFGNGAMGNIFASWVNSVTDFEIISGTGTPEGAVFAKKTKLYMDESGSAGNILYIKTTEVQLNTGWVLV